jgi:thiol:disulfide interchange protein DsbA
MPRACLLALLLLLMPVQEATGQRTPIAGVDYRVLTPTQPTEAAGRVEVIEFFWYRCPHCYALESHLESWLAVLPRDVSFRRVPVVFGGEWITDARIFYALEAIGEFGRLHGRLLEAIHDGEGKGLKGDPYERWVSEWMRAQGVDPRRFESALRSARVAARVGQAQKLTEAYGVSGTPNFAVQGRFVIKPPPGDRRRVLAITDHLIRESRIALLAGRTP